MKVTAYKCDICGALSDNIEFIKGFLNNVSIFDAVNESFTLVNNPEKAPYHFCTNCYNSRVVIPALNGSSRQTDEGAYKSLLADYLYSLKKQAITNVEQAKK